MSDPSLTPKQLVVQAQALLTTALARWPEDPIVPAVPPTPATPATPPVAATSLRRPEKFFNYVKTREPLGPSLTQAEVDGCNRIIAACAKARFPISWTAYCLATCFHETAGTMFPIREYGKGKGKRYGVPGRHGGQVPYGRGDVQLTWASNYEAMDLALGLSGRLLADYDLALDPPVSADIMTIGMQKGLFTGLGLPKTLPTRLGSEAQFKESRKIINGTDKDDEIAAYAVVFQQGLIEGEYP